MNKTNNAYDRETALRLAAEAREDDELMHTAPWIADPAVPLSGSTTVRSAVCVCTGQRPSADFCPACHFVADWVPVENAPGIVRTRNNLRAIAEQLAAAVERVDELESEREGILETSIRINKNRNELQMREAGLADGYARMASYACSELEQVERRTVARVVEWLRAQQIVGAWTLARLIGRGDWKAK